MKYFRHKAPGNGVTIYPFVCWHIGASQSDEKFIREMIDRVKDDPSARWIYMGDGGECVTKASKGCVFTQTMSIQEQFNELVDLMKPIRKKALFGVNGNHGNRVFKETGMSFDESLMLALGIPYMGTACFWNLEVGRSIYSIFTHHGLSSGATISSKISAAKKVENFLHCDAIMSAHSHIAAEIPPRHVAFIDKDADDPIRWTTTYEYICGCAYDSRTGYAEEKGYSPILPAHVSLDFSGKIIRGRPVKRQSCTIYRAEA